MANNCTATIPNNDAQAPNLLDWDGLHESKYAFDTTFQLQLADGNIVHADRVIRVIPKRRLVAFGRWQEKEVFIKFFIDSKRAKSHMEKDVEGVNILLENKIPTPALLYQGTTKDERICVLVYERIFDSKNLEEKWLEKQSLDDIMPLLKAVTVELATQHVLGIMQNDLYFKNFLITEKTIYTVDGAEIEHCSQMLPKRSSMHNLARFLSQLGVGTEEYKEELFRHYAKARGWLLKDEDVFDLMMMIKHRDEYRRSRYEKKIFRECTDFSRITKWHTFAMFERGIAAPDFMRFLYNPELAFNHPSTQIIKNGGSSTVVRVAFDGKDLVVKRYNIKSTLHFLRRCLRMTRAATSWRISQKLNLFGIATAKPMAFIDKRFFCFRGKSYLVMEYIPGQDIAEYFQGVAGDESKTNSMVKRIVCILKGLAMLDVTHGDLKSSNILIDQKDQPILIDFDGAVEHSNQSSLRTAWKKEIKRFFKNFDNQTSVKEKFVRELGD